MLRLEDLRKKHGLSQEALAKKMNMTQQRISAYEKGKREPDIETLKQFADFFNCSIDYLLNESENINHNENEEEFYFAYHKEMDGLTPEEIEDALRFYKEMKKKVNKNNKKDNK